MNFFNKKNNQIGQILIDAGLIQESQLDKIRIAQSEFNLKFGEAAVKLGYVTEDNILRALSKQFNHTFFDEKTTKIDKRIVLAFKSNHSAEELRNLRSQLLLQTRGFSKKIIGIVSPQQIDSSNSSILSARLAVSLAMLGSKTLLIDANLREPVQSKLFGVNNDYGLSDLLADRANFECIKKIPEIDKLGLITSGTSVPNPQELISTKLFKLTIDELARQYDYIVIDMPNAEEYADSLIISSAAEGMILTVEKGITTQKSLAAITKKLNDAAISIIGVVIV